MRCYDLECWVSSQRVATGGNITEVGWNRLKDRPVGCSNNLLTNLKIPTLLLHPQAA